MYTGTSAHCYFWWHYFSHVYVHSQNAVRGHELHKVCYITERCTIQFIRDWYSWYSVGCIKCRAVLNVELHCCSIFCYVLSVSCDSNYVTAIFLKMWCLGYKSSTVLLFTFKNENNSKERWQHFSTVWDKTVFSPRECCSQKVANGKGLSTKEVTSCIRVYWSKRLEISEGHHSHLPKWEYTCMLPQKVLKKGRHTWKDVETGRWRSMLPCPLRQEAYLQ